MTRRGWFATLIAALTRPKALVLLPQPPIGSVRIVQYTAGLAVRIR